MAQILIIDDDMLNSQIYQARLQQENLTADICSDSMRAAEKIREKYDLIILDIMMPGMDGTQVLKNIKDSVNSNSVILVFTNLLSGKIKTECLENGAKEYLLKADFTPNQLVEKIKSYLPSGQ